MFQFLYKICTRHQIATGAESHYNESLNDIDTLNQNEPREGRLYNGFSEKQNVQKKIGCTEVIVITIRRFRCRYRPHRRTLSRLWRRHSLRRNHRRRNLSFLLVTLNY